MEQLIQNNGLIPRYALRLTESGHVTQDNMLPPAELKRRAVLKAMCVKAVVKFNGRVVTSTDYHPLRVGSMSVDFNKYFEFRVLHQPSDVTIDLYTKKVFLFILFCFASHLFQRVRCCLPYFYFCHPRWTPVPCFFISCRSIRGTPRRPSWPPLVCLFLPRVQVSSVPVRVVWVAAVVEVQQELARWSLCFCC